MKISIIIPTSGRALQLKKALESICLNYPQNSCEVIVIENGVKDNSEQIVSEIKKNFNAPRIQHHYNKTPGLLTGRHMGAEFANGDVLCFLDDDVEVGPRYIESVSKAFHNDSKLQLATGPCLPKYEIDPPDWFKYLWTNIPEGKFCTWLSLLDFGTKDIFIDASFVWGLNFCIRKITLFQLGGFHPDCVPDELQGYQGDGETGLTFKATSQGIKAKYLGGLTIHHNIYSHRLTETYLKKRAFYNGVCNSFTTLRNEHLNSEKNDHQLPGKIRKAILPFYSRLRNFLFAKSSERKPIEVEKLLTDLRNAEAEGFKFHQQGFNTDLKIRSWVLKENYWDFEYPE